MALEFNIKLQANQYINWNSIHICFPIEIKSKADDHNDILVNTITVNNVFAYWIKEIDIKRHLDNSQILPTGHSADIYRYSDAMLKQIHAKAMKTFRKTFCIGKNLLIFLQISIDDLIQIMM